LVRGGHDSSSTYDSYSDHNNELDLDIWFVYLIIIIIFVFVFQHWQRQQCQHVVGIFECRCCRIDPRTMHSKCPLCHQCCSVSSASAVPLTDYSFALEIASSLCCTMHRKLGCVIFLCAEDIVELKGQLILTLVAAIMERALALGIV
jgi:hypothetical protein